MKKSILSTTAIALLIIAALEYIIFSANMGAFAVIIGIPVLSALMCSARNKRVLICLIAFGSIVSLISGAMYGYFTDVQSGLAFVIEYFQLHLPAFVLYRCAVDKGLELKPAIIRTTAANLAVTVVDLALVKYLRKINMTDTIAAYMDEFSQNYMSVISTVDFGVKIDTETVSKALELVSAGLIMFMPAILILICMLMSYIAFVIGKALIANFTKVKISAMSKLRFFHIGNGLSFFTLFILIFTFMSESSYFAGGVYNFALLSAFAYMINGLAVVDFLLAKRVKSNSGHKLLMILIVILSVISSVSGSPISGLSVLFFTGLIDVSFDFRKMHRLK